MATQTQPEEPGDGQHYKNSPFSETHLRVMASGSLAITFGVFVFVLANPLYLEIPVIRYIVCLMLSLPVSVFFFVFWPQKLETTVVPLVNIPIRLAGPVVLWLAVFALFVGTMPAHEPRVGKFFLVRPTLPDQQVRFFSDTQVLRKGTGEPLEKCYLVENPSLNTHLLGIYVEFEAGERQIEAELRMPKRKPVEVVFDRATRMVNVPPVALEGESK